MKILSLHCDYIKFKPVKLALKGAMLEKAEEKEINVKEPLVIFTAIEKQDEMNKGILEDYIKNVLDLMDKTKAKNIVLYPYAHLSSSLSSPDFAKQLMVDAEKELKKKKIDVHRAPFGFYKEFELKCKGHPLAELSRIIGVEQEAKGKVEVTKSMNAESTEVTEAELGNILKKLTKVKMNAERSKEGLKSNVELGKELDLYVVNEVVGSGLPLLTPKGATIKRELERFAVDEELKRGYEHTATPVMAKSDLYKISGHWQHYKDLMFVLDVGGETFALRPMTCPFQFIIYKSKPRSYKELPIRYAEISNLFRNEKSGELMGLTRLRQFTLSDAHIICRPDQIEEEFAKVLEFIKYMMKTLKIEDIWYRFSKWDPKDKGGKYINNPKAWDASQKMMKKILDKLKVKYAEADGEAAFYGPKLDIQYNNIFGKEDTLITIQIDFALPEKYDMTYIDEKNQSQRPMVIHRSSIGCTERTMAYLLEKTQGNLPTWLSPVQVKIMSFTDKNIKAAEKIFKEFKEAGIRCEINTDSAPVQGKVRDAEMQKIPYIIMIGDKEEAAKTLAVRKDSKVEFGVKKEAFLKDILEEIKERK